MQYKYKSYDNIQDFPYSWNSSENIQISRYTLLHSFLTTGRTIWFLVYPSVPKSWEPILYPLTKRSLGWYIGRFIWINSLLDTESGNLRLADFYNTLDPSEKAQVTYTLATIITGITARVKYSIPWLLHLDVAINKRLVRLRTGRKRGDLIGFSSLRNQWFVIEAKGRQKVDRILLESAKSQVNNIAYIQDDKGRHPIIGFISVLRVLDTPIENSWVDPPIQEENVVAMKLEEFLWFYYQDIARFIFEKNDIITCQKEYLCRKVKIPHFGYIGIGLHEKIILDIFGISEEYRKFNNQYFSERYGKKLIEVYLNLVENEGIPKNYKRIDNGVIGPDAVLVLGDCLKNGGETWI